MIVSLMMSCSDDVKLKPLSQNATILAFGDSLTYGTGTSRDKAYPAVLSHLINHQVINAGVPGEISKQGLQRLPALLKKHKPELLILCHGANDILRKKDLIATKSNIQKMIDLAQLKNTQVVLVGVPEFSLFLSTSPIYQELAQENKVAAELDIIGKILAQNALKSDHIHPNTQGYQLFAEKIASLLEQSGAL